MISSIDISESCGSIIADLVTSSFVRSISEDHLLAHQMARFMARTRSPCPLALLGFSAYCLSAFQRASAYSSASHGERTFTLRRMKWRAALDQRSRLERGVACQPKLEVGLTGVSE